MGRIHHPLVLQSQPVAQAGKTLSTNTVVSTNDLTLRAGHRNAGLFLRERIEGVVSTWADQI